MPDDPVKTVCCPSCHEWYDARAAACYLCGTERPEYNAALATAVLTDRLNSSLAGQNRAASEERRLTQMIPSGGLGGRSGPAQLYPGSSTRDLASSIREKIFNGD